MYSFNGRGGASLLHLSGMVSSGDIISHESLSGSVVDTGAGVGVGVGVGVGKGVGKGVGVGVGKGVALGVVVVG